MKLNGGEALQKHLVKGNAPLYLLQGEEPCLLEESLEMLRHAFREKGFSERVRYTLDSSFDLAELQSMTQNFSLFSEKKLVELHCGDKMPSEISSWLHQYTEQVQQAPDLILIVTCSKLTPQQQKAKWVLAIEHVGVLVTIWKVSLAQYPTWLEQRLVKKGLKLTPAAKKILTEETEGNLEAALQILFKLSLVTEPGALLELSHIEPLLADHAHYDLFDLSGQILLGNIKRSLRILSFLEAEGEAVLILWAISRELKVLLQIHEQKNRLSLSILYRQLNVWEKRQVEIECALKRLSMKKVMEALLQCADIDLIIKGLKEGDASFALRKLVLSLCT